MGIAACESNFSFPILPSFTVLKDIILLRYLLYIHFYKLLRIKANIVCWNIFCIFTTQKLSRLMALYDHLSLKSLFYKYMYVFVWKYPVYNKTCSSN